MRSCPQFTNAPPPSRSLDLSVDSEATRSALYALVAGIVFDPPADAHREPVAATEAAEQARLVILCLFGDFFAAWAVPVHEAAGRPACRRFEMVRIKLDPAAPAGVTLSEV